MKVTNDHYKNLQSGAWKFDDEDVIFIEDDSGTSWVIRPGNHGGMLIRCIGNDKGHDRIIIAAQVSNEIVIRAESL